MVHAALGGPAHRARADAVAAVSDPAPVYCPYCPHCGYSPEMMRIHVHERHQNVAQPEPPSLPKAEPHTAAGRDLLHDFDNEADQYSVNSNTETNWDRVRRGILAIEAEAAAPEPLDVRDRVKAAIRKLWTDADAIQDSQTGSQKARNIAAEALRQAAVEVERALDG